MEAQDSHPAHGVRPEHSAGMFRDKCWLRLALALPVVYWSSEVRRWLGYRAPTFLGPRNLRHFDPPLVAVKALRRLVVRVAMITGDSQAVADSIAKRLGIDLVAAVVLPPAKASAVQEFRAGRQRVAMVGMM